MSEFPFISPGPVGVPDDVVFVGEISQLRPHYFPRKLLQGGHASVYRPNVGGVITTDVKVSGLNLVGRHIGAIDAYIPPALTAIHFITADYATAAARQTITEFGAIDSGDTKRSIHGRVETGPNSVMASIGPTTFYSPFIEFGLAQHAGKGPRPFMSKAFSEVLPDHIRAHNELAAVMAGRKLGVAVKPYSKQLNGLLASIRPHLYKLEKRLGDTVFLGHAVLPGVRSGLINAARGIGDLQSIMQSAVGQRFVRRLEGKVTGRLIGIGSNTIFASTDVAARISGAERAYNREVGKFSARFTSQSNQIAGIND